MAFFHVSFSPTFFLQTLMSARGMFPSVVPKGAALTLKGITTVNASKDMGRALKMIESYAEVQLSENTI